MERLRPIDQKSRGKPISGEAIGYGCEIILYKSNDFEEYYINFFAFYKSSIVYVYPSIVSVGHLGNTGIFESFAMSPYVNDSIVSFLIVKTARWFISSLASEATGRFSIDRMPSVLTGVAKLRDAMNLSLESPIIA